MDKQVLVGLCNCTVGRLIRIPCEFSQAALGRRDRTCLSALKNANTTPKRRLVCFVKSQIPSLGTLTGRSSVGEREQLRTGHSKHETSEVTVWDQEEVLTHPSGWAGNILTQRLFSSIPLSPGQPELLLQRKLQAGLSLSLQQDTLGGTQIGVSGRN